MAEGVVVNLRTIGRRELIILQNANAFTLFIWTKTLKTVTRILENIYLISLHQSVAIGCDTLVFAGPHPYDDVLITSPIQRTVRTMSYLLGEDGLGMWARSCLILIIIIFLVF